MRDDNEKIQGIDALHTEMSRDELSEEQLGNVAGGIIIIGGMPSFGLNVLSATALTKTTFERG